MRCLWGPVLLQRTGRIWSGSALAFALGVVMVATGCSEPPLGPIAATHAGERGLSVRSARNGLTLAHDYRIVRSEQDFRRLVTRLKQARTRQDVQTQQVECGILQSIVSTGDAEASSYQGYRLGAVQIWARPGRGSSPSFFFLMPDRFLDHCFGWLYGPVSDDYEEGAIPEGYGTEGYDDAPNYPPDEVSAEEWAELNQAERKLLWDTFWSVPREGFLAYVQNLRQARSEAEQWAASIDASGAHNGRQDALRHAYWNCRMSQLLGESSARAWGNAHEKYSDVPAEARMDLHNNAVGRQVARTHESCAAGVLAADANKLLRLTPAPAPSFQSPFSPQPPPPPEDT